jgi:hypothetical protein
MNPKIGMYLAGLISLKVQVTFSVRLLKKSLSMMLLLVGSLLVIAPAAFSMTAFAASTSNTLYTGYEVVGPYTTLRVEGSWVVPTANCAVTPNSVSNISVIIDGIHGEGDGMEIGTYQDCVNGVAKYGAFVNIYPMTVYFGENNGNISNVVIHPGDVVEAQGTWRPTTQKPINWNTNFIDETTGAVKVNTDAKTSATFTPKLDSGAIILSSDGKTLTSLSTINTGREYTGIKFSDISGPQSADSTLSQTAALSGFSLVTWQIPGTDLSALADSGSSFQITSA